MAVSLSFSVSLLLMFFVLEKSRSGKVTLWRTCHGPAPAYAAAWFGRRDTVQETLFGDKLGMEYHDFYMFNQGGNGHPRVCLKSADAEDFWVDHLSELEHSLKRSRLKGQGRNDAVEEAASAVLKTECDERRFPEKMQEVVAVIPYWGGMPETDSNGKVVGNSHSRAGRALKEKQVRATACSIRNFFDGTVRVVIGIAKEEDRIEGEEVWLVSVEHGAYLAFGLLRELQRRIEEDGMLCNYVYFTEADQILHGSLQATDLMAAVGQHFYVAPNRLVQLATSSKPALFDYRGVSYSLSSNVCNGDLVATLDTALFSPPPPMKQLKGVRGARFTATTPGSSVRRAPSRDQVHASRKKVAWRNEVKRNSSRRAFGSARNPTLVASFASNATVFARCWNAEDKQRSTAWFVHAKQFLACNFDNLKDPIKSLQALSTVLDEIKRSRAWHSWALAPVEPSDFATCRQCRGRWPPSSSSSSSHENLRKEHSARHHLRSHASGPRRKRLYDEGRRSLTSADETGASLGVGREEGEPHPCALYSSGFVVPAKSANVSDVVALLPIDEAMVSDQAATTSICSARETFSTVVVGYCSKDPGHSALVARLEVLLGVGFFSTVSFEDCVIRTPASTRADRQTSASLLLVKHAADQLQTKKPNWPFVDYVFFAPLGDLIVVRDLDALKSAVSTTAYVVAHRYHDTKTALDTAIRSPSCDQAHRDWIIPLTSPHRRSDIRADLSAYLAIPR